MSNKISIRFYKDHKVRAIWDEEQNQWWFSVLDVEGAINEQDDHEKNRNYWKYLKAKLKKEQNEVVSSTTQLKYPRKSLTSSWGFFVHNISYVYHTRHSSRVRSMYSLSRCWPMNTSFCMRSP